MANLRDDDRAQVLLVAGFVLAASFVALTLVLNSVIYTENLATRGDDAGGENAISYRNDVTEGLERVLESVNRNGSTKAKIHDDLSDAVVSTSRRAAQFEVLQGTSANTSLAAVTWGTRIGQNQTTGNFSNSTEPSTADVASDWTLATGVQGTRSATIDVTDSSMLDQSGDDPLTLRVSDGSDDWTLTLYNDGTADDTWIEITNASGSGTCSADGNPTIGLTAGTFNGTDCPALKFGEGVSAPYDIEVRNGDAFQGTYSMVVRDASIDTTNYGTAPDVPFALPAVYAATVHVEYRSASLSYATDAEVRPGESDD
ncbi:hypothetical protein BV210_02620 [Halorientalis sp. IM1011]|uniref:DUF7261 family protein n=1 Tax=Halorientalis sp. IM1011 TaxID=1932360 RepID=UPI00097CC5CE|nr:hypothetical protein [Halorientalis sp. IM1011]AQL41673.1 hypothetical protein BV210_02620 [Halorientalis sp. IM1011]